MKRYAHYWWPTKGARFPSRIAVLDCDAALLTGMAASRVQREELTHWSLHSIRLTAGAPVCHATGAGDGLPGMWGAVSSLLTSSDQTWLFITPASRILALLKFWEALERGDVVLAGSGWSGDHQSDSTGASDGAGICILEDPPTVIACRTRGRPGKLLILDIRNWGIEALPSGDTADERCTAYMDGIHSVLSTLRAHGRLSLRCTAGSQAMSSLRSDPKCVRLHCHTLATCLRIERAAYYGGRCECYRIGELAPPIYHLDVRSMYPALCRTLPIPVSLRRYHGTPRLAERACRDRPDAVIAHVTVKSAVPAYPCRIRGDVVYPVGIFDTTLCGSEVTNALKAGAITRWYSCAEYVMAPLLSGYYEWWLARLADARQAGRAMEAQWIKRVMNALVGKFGEPGRRWEAAPAQPEHGPYGTWYEFDRDGKDVRCRNVAGYTQREEISGESYWSIPAIAAWVTAAGRMRLWHYLEMAGRENVWYCDTDSLLCNRRARDRLSDIGAIRDSETGYLRCCGIHTRGIVHGIRHYQLDDEIRCSGVPKGHIEPSESRAHYWHRQQLAAAAQQGYRPDAIRHLRDYPPADVYRHGRVQADGSVLPLEVYQSEQG